MGVDLAGGYYDAGGESLSVDMQDGVAASTCVKHANVLDASEVCFNGLEFMKR